MTLLEKLVRLRLRIDAREVLNDDGQANVKPPRPDDLAEGVRRLRITAGAQSDSLDYGHLSLSKAYRDYRRLTQGLRGFDAGILHGTEEKTAFWINVYNGLIMDAVIRWLVGRSVQDEPGFFWRAAYNVGGHRFSASDIEHGVLRANSPYPAWPRPMFSRSDPRLRYALERVDPRVHFTLVCASRSCPTISVYRAEELDTQLSQASQVFIRHGGTELDTNERQIKLSRIFQWYAPDFGASWMAIGDKQRLLDFVMPHLPLDQADQLQAGRWSVAFKEYDWSLNGQWSEV